MLTVLLPENDRSPALRDLPFILETPNDLAGYAREIGRLKELRAE